QLAVGAADGAGRRTLNLYSRAEDAEDTWVRHATGVLGTAVAGAGEGLAEWPPAGAEPVETEGYYEGLAEAGFDYGPAFRGLRAAWRRGDEVYAEVALDAAPAGFGLHPALLDAALHGIGLGSFLGDGAHVPFSWSGVTLAATGATAARVRISPAGADAVRVTLADGTGAPLAAVESLVLRPLTGDAGAPAQGRTGGIYG
ncbi:polyketide synthase dehydratase domain-containing protein, partial [Streptomyces violaceoruber]